MEAKPEQLSLIITARADASSTGSLAQDNILMGNIRKHETVVYEPWPSK